MHKLVRSLNLTTWWAILWAEGRADVLHPLAHPVHTAGDGWPAACVGVDMLAKVHGGALLPPEKSIKLKILTHAALFWRDYNQSHTVCFTLITDSYMLSIRLEGLQSVTSYLFHFDYRQLHAFYSSGGITISHMLGVLLWFQAVTCFLLVSRDNNKSHTVYFTLIT